MKCILVGLDGSPREPDVLQVAADLTERYGAQLVLFRSIGLPPEVPQDIRNASGISLNEFLTQQAEAGLNACAARLPAGLKDRHRLRTVIATPWQGICGVAREERADLIVIGSHGYGGLDRLLGTTAARVVDHAPCSVLVVRAQNP
jgi:nucleotide-binding universal stress UspA family protein